MSAVVVVCEQRPDPFAALLGTSRGLGDRAAADPQGGAAAFRQVYAVLDAYRAGSMQPLARTLRACASEVQADAAPALRWLIEQVAEATVPWSGAQGRWPAQVLADRLGVRLMVCDFVVCAPDGTLHLWRDGAAAPRSLHVTAGHTDCADVPLSACVRAPRGEWALGLRARCERCAQPMSARELRNDYRRADPPGLDAELAAWPHDDWPLDERATELMRNRFLAKLIDRLRSRPLQAQQTLTVRAQTAYESAMRDALARQAAGLADQRVVLARALAGRFECRRPLMATARRSERDRLALAVDDPALALAFSLRDAARASRREQEVLSLGVQAWQRLAARAWRADGPLETGRVGAEVAEALRRRARRTHAGAAT